MSITIVLLSLLPGVLVGALTLAAAARVRAVRRALERQSAELAAALAHAQAVEELARLTELSPDLDRMAEGAGAVLSRVAGADRHAVYLATGEGVDGLRPIRHETALSAGDGALSRAALETGITRLLEHEGCARIFLPLTARGRGVGVLHLDGQADGRGFDAARVKACERLAAFAAEVLQSGARFRQADDERRAVGRMAKLLVGREAKMRELKERLQVVTRL